MPTKKFNGTPWSQRTTALAAGVARPKKDLRLPTYSLHFQCQLLKLAWEIEG